MILLKIVLLSLGLVLACGPVKRRQDFFFFSRNVNHNREVEIAHAFGFSLTNDPRKYLGLPLCHKRATSNGFSYITDRLLQRLRSWKANLVSLAGCITLCSSVLAVVPSYHMQTCLLPGLICHKVDKICRKFVWGGIGEKHRLH